LTQFVSVVTCVALSAVSPRMTTSKPARTDGEMNETSSVVNASTPSLRRISPMYIPNGLAVEVTIRTGGGDASVENDQLTSAAIGLPT
jgi:hypothetical protein